MYIMGAKLIIKQGDSLIHDIKKAFDQRRPIVTEMFHKDTDAHGNFQKPGRPPRFSDIDLLTLSIVAESLSLDSEHALFQRLQSDYQDAFPTLIDRSGYNVRRRKLAPVLDQLRQRLQERLIPQEDRFLVDSMPLPVCQIARANRARICRAPLDTVPATGYCASQDQWYYGYKLHTVCTLNGVVTSLDLTPANTADIHYLRDIKAEYAQCVIYGDKGYLGQELQLDLFTSRRIHVETPMRRNQQDYRPQPGIIRRARKRIETFFSQLCDQFLIHRNYAKTFAGLATRVLAKVTAFTLLQYVNKFVKKRPLNQVKHALAYFHTTGLK